MHQNFSFFTKLLFLQNAVSRVHFRTKKVNFSVDLKKLKLIGLHALRNLQAKNQEKKEKSEMLFSSYQILKHVLIII